MDCIIHPPGLWQRVSAEAPVLDKQWNHDAGVDRLGS